MIDQTAQLIAAIGALWAALTALAGKVIHWLSQEMTRRDAAHEKRLKEEQDACRAELARLNGKLDGAADLLTRQNESMQRQLDAQQQMIATLQAALAKGSSP